MDTLTPDQIKSFSAELTSVGFPDDGAGFAGQVRAAAIEVARVRRLRELAAEAERLRPLADLGKQYREALTRDALAAGRQALGQRFDARAYGDILARASLATICRMRDDWRRIGRTP